MYKNLVRSFSSTGARFRDVYILSSVRTPIGNFGGALASLSAVELGTSVAKEAVKRANVKPDAVEEVLFGQVLQATSGQAPARQVTIDSGLPVTTEATTVNKVCASGLKTVAMATQMIKLGDRDVILAGGMESMSNTPFYIKRNQSFGNGKLSDSIIDDGLTDAFDRIHMGLCCENTNKRENITREDQDDYAIESYKRAQAAQKEGAFVAEILPISVKTRKGVTEVKDDESAFGVNFDKIRTLRPAFDKNGTVTAANASSLNDGAAAIVVASGEKAKELGANVSAKVIAYADAATTPIDFTIAPSLAIPHLLEKAGLTAEDIAVWEINEAFSGVSIANNRRLDLDPAKVNPKGGAVALGHPIGASGARILTTLLHELKDGEYGVAAICNGGGAATSLLVQKTSKIE